MKTNTIILALAALILAAMIPTGASAQVRIDFRIGFGPAPHVMNRYYVSLSDEYGVSYRDICAMHDAGVIDEDMPIILYIFTNSHYSLRHIYSLRLNGATWNQLSMWCGVRLYLDDCRRIAVRSGPPYGNAYGHYKHGRERVRRDRDFSDDRD